MPLGVVAGGPNKPPPPTRGEWYGLRDGLRFSMPLLGGAAG